jgi:hypothetical protein
VRADAGDIDLTFAQAGVVFVDFNLYYDLSRTVAVQPAGGPWAAATAGSTRRREGGGGRRGVVRQLLALCGRSVAGRRDARP